MKCVCLCLCLKAESVGKTQTPSYLIQSLNKCSVCPQRAWGCSEGISRSLVLVTVSYGAPQRVQWVNSVAPCGSYKNGLDPYHVHVNVFTAKIYMRVRAYAKHTKYGYRLVYDFCSLNLGSSSSGIHLKHFRRLKTAQSNPLVSFCVLSFELSFSNRPSQPRLWVYDSQFKQPVYQDTS